MSEVGRSKWLLAIASGVFCTLGHLHSEPGGNLIDPTRPKGWRSSVQAPTENGQSSVTVLQLQGVFSLAGKRSAVISGQRVVVGDEVAGAQVLEIEKNKVILQVDGKEIELASLLPDVKSPSSGKVMPR